MRKINFLLVFGLFFIFACNQNTKLSPVDINTATKDSTLKALYCDYTVTDNCQINVDDGVTISVSGNYLVIPSEEDYRGEEVTLSEILIKSPSEHTIKGQHYPLELQFVHYADSSDVPVIASVFVEEGAENQQLAKIIENLPAKGQSKSIDGLDIYMLFPQNPEYWFYFGSTTQKPYIQGVKWFVMKTPITATTEQIQKIVESIGKKELDVVQGAEIYEY
jgi:carbonic anhydrase